MTGRASGRYPPCTVHFHESAFQGGELHRTYTFATTGLIGAVRRKRDARAAAGGNSAGKACAKKSRPLGRGVTRTVGTTTCPIPGFPRLLTVVLRTKSRVSCPVYLSCLSSHRKVTRARPDLKGPSCAVSCERTARPTMEGGNGLRRTFANLRRPERGVCIHGRILPGLSQVPRLVQVVGVAYPRQVSCLLPMGTASLSRSADQEVHALGESSPRPKDLEIDNL